MKIVDDKHISKLYEYIKTFNIRYSAISEELGLDKSLIGKYFSNKVNMSTVRYNEILQVLKKFAGNDELKIYLIDTWLKIETKEEKEISLKNLSKRLDDLSIELKGIIGG